MQLAGIVLPIQQMINLRHSLAILVCCGFLLLCLSMHTLWLKLPDSSAFPSQGSTIVEPFPHRADLIDPTTDALLTWFKKRGGLIGSMQVVRSGAGGHK